MAHYQATGKTNLIGVAIKSADHICQTFGPAASQLHEPPGHEAIEIGLVSPAHGGDGRKPRLRWVSVSRLLLPQQLGFRGGEFFELLLADFWVG